jgi:hypothetical protein
MTGVYASKNWEWVLHAGICICLVRVPVEIARININQGNTALTLIVSIVPRMVIRATDQIVGLCQNVDQVDSDDDLTEILAWYHFGDIPMMCRPNAFALPTTYCTKVHFGGRFPVSATAFWRDLQHVDWLDRYSQSRRLSIGHDR